MKLVQILLPTRYNTGRRIPAARFAATAAELTERFGGLTAHTRAPAEGLWKPGRRTRRDDIVIFEVVAPRLQRRWWRDFRRRLEADYRQEKIQTRVLDFEAL